MDESERGLTCPMRFSSIPGHDGRSNDIIYCRPVCPTDEEHSSVAVFFGGDVMDFTENMQSHRDNRNYLKWNLENTARIMQKMFRSCHILVVRPSKMEYKTFSCYENFVPSSKCGTPEHTPMHFALAHLESLLANISNKLRNANEEELKKARELSRNAMVQIDFLSDSTSDNATDNKISASTVKDEEVEDVWHREKIHLEKCSLQLIGFSKGCVVLNQFVYEFHYAKTLTPEDDNLSKIISKVTHMYWLDGGHSGGKNTWITSRPLLETLTRLNIDIHVHVTPYQIQDDRRPWIKKEEKAFYDILVRQGARINRTVHFVNLVPNLLLHFDLLTVFKTPDSMN